MAVKSKNWATYHLLSHFSVHCTSTLLPFCIFMRNTATVYRIWIIGILVCIIFPLHIVDCVDPKFDPSTRMRLVLVPADAQVGSVIYRLRATDEEFDYPLTFELIGDAASATIKIESLPCTKYNSVCQANVVLQRRLEPGRYYDFQVSVKDTKGGVASQLCSITATNFTTPHDLIFPHKPGIIMIPEVRLEYPNIICNCILLTFKYFIYNTFFDNGISGCKAWYRIGLCNCTEKPTFSKASLP